MRMRAFFSGRSLLWWLGLFPTLYMSSVMLYVSVIDTGAMAFLTASQLAGPALFFLFAWLYFRGLEIQTFEFHLATAVMWAALTLLGNALLMPAVYGESWSVAFSRGALAAQGINAAAVILAGFIAKRRPRRLTPSGPETRP